ncbi:unnamed protein product [Cylindrotheca closterium]|uniref:Uncharacterized protein n=1 Tax=Cylindrotheca closterium TaxID=2856 RepID=A0AAD2JL22_9STRA|nr:unnamed protein product [Cylindrotheca closterium]
MFKDVQQEPTKIMLGNCTVAKDTDGDWHWSPPAEASLRVDVQNGKHKDMKPKMLHQQRDEYKAFDLKPFWAHIYQETRRNKDSAYWLGRKKKKEKRLAKHQGKRYKDDDNYFYDPFIDFVSLKD